MSISSPISPPAAPLSDREQRFDWPLCYEAENLVLGELARFLAGNTFARTLSQRMRDETGTLFLDWVDHLVLPQNTRPQFEAAGFVPDPLAERESPDQPLSHPEAMLPRVVFSSAKGPAVVALKVDEITNFMRAHALTLEPEGAPLSRYRRVVVATENQMRLEIVERRGYRGYTPGTHRVGELESIMRARELWLTRARHTSDESRAYEDALALLDRIIAMVGRDMACHVVFEAERIYWQERNRAAQQQKMRQDRLGLGWSNHDHHTFRSSRAHFLNLMTALEKLGFHRRERYYAGAQAGWGAQILEQPVEGIVTFCDVDLAPDETAIDFSRTPLPAANKLGTIGLWVGLHGESFLDAGMHHLECRFDFALLREQLAREGIGTMKPFSDFPFLKQAFTEAERWSVRPERAEKLHAQGLINTEQLRHFVAEGALGSHLENLQRKGGFKGFNQQSVSAIIAATDPRK